MLTVLIILSMNGELEGAALASAGCDKDWERIKTSIETARMAGYDASATVVSLDDINMNSFTLGHITAGQIVL